VRSAASFIFVIDFGPAGEGPRGQLLIRSPQAGARSSRADFHSMSCRSCSLWSLLRTHRFSSTTFFINQILRRHNSQAEVPDSDLFISRARLRTFSSIGFCDRIVASKGNHFGF
jgi:hypothetical protein